MSKHTIEDIRREYSRLDAITGIDSSNIPIVISTRAKRRHGWAASGYRCSCGRQKFSLLQDKRGG